jgi:hypothetical protein
VDLLSGMMVTKLLKTQDLSTPLGDGGFMTKTAGLVIFTRYNVAVHLQVEAGDIQHVMDLAYIIDRDLTSIPIRKSDDAPPVIKEISLAASSVKAGTEVPFTFKYHDKAGSELYAKLWTSAGPIMRKDGKLRLLARHKGKHKLRIFLLSAHGTVGVAERNIEVM